MKRVFKIRFAYFKFAYTTSWYQMYLKRIYKRDKALAWNKVKNMRSDEAFLTR